MPLMKPLTQGFSFLRFGKHRPSKFRFSKLLPLLLIVITIYCFLELAWPKRFVLPSLFGESVFCVNTPDKVLALTFDDGPDPVYTRAIAQTLSDYQAQGTFFVLGKHSKMYPQIVQSLQQQGHQIANHTWNHYNLNSKFKDTIYKEITETDILINQLISPHNIYFRPPFGRAGFMVTDVLKQIHKPVIFWDVDLQDWLGKSAAEMMKIFENNFHNGSIILLHDSDGLAKGGVYANRHHTVEVVEEILKTYIPLGYEFVTVSELLKRGNVVKVKERCLKK
jgi:peptidoglycan/xylan/chitin deacetylase (PgdA/CDA1 family)